MGRQRNNLQSKGKEKSSEKELNKIETRDLSDIEFKIIVIRMLKGLNESYKELYGATRNLVGTTAA